MKVFKNFTAFTIVAICFAIGLSGFASHRTQEQVQHRYSFEHDYAGFRFVREQHSLIKPVVTKYFINTVNDKKPDNTNYQLIHWDEMSYQLKK